MGFIKLVAGCFHLLAWPLITLVYPLYASIGALESNSLANYRKWLTYWVLCGLIMLFELISAGLIECLPFWPHIKLVITFGLVVPYFGGPICAYDRLVKPCLNMNPQLIVDFLRSKQHGSRIHNSPDFLLLVERYVQEKGSEALEEIIFGKVTCVEPTHFAAKSDSLASLNEEDAKVIKRIKSIKPSLTQTEYGDITVTDNKPVTKDETVSGGSEFHQSSTPEKIRKEWTCDLCQVCTNSEVVLQDHFQGKKHIAKAKAQEKDLFESTNARMDNKADTSIETRPAEEDEVSGGVCEWLEPSCVQDKTQKEWTCALCQVCTQSEDALHNHLQGETHKAKEKELMEFTPARHNKNEVTSTENKSTLTAEVAGCDSECPGSSSSSSPTLDTTQKEWSCALCQLCIESEASLQSHLQGKKHKAKEKKLIESTTQTDNKAIVAMDSKQTTEASVAVSVDSCPGSSSSSSSILDKTLEWTCVLCQLCVGSEASLQSHLQGKKHKAKEKKLIDSTHAQTDNKAIVADNKLATEAEAVSGVCECPASPSSVPDKTQESTCDLPRLCVSNEATPSHDLAMKHKGEECIEFTCAQTDDRTVAATENKPAPTSAVETEVGGVCEPPVSSSLIPKKANDWTCAICQLCITNEASLHYHLQGKKHKAKERKLKESTLAQPDQDKTDSATENKTAPATEVTHNVCESPKSASISDKTQEWTCTLCQFCTASETTLWYHMQGKKHKTKEKEVMEKQMEAENKIPSVSNTRKIDKSNAMPMKQMPASAPKVIYVEKSKNIAVGGTRIGDQWEQTNPNMEPRIKLSALWCENCKLQCNSLSMLAEHLGGKRHLRRKEEVGETF